MNPKVSISEIPLRNNPPKPFRNAAKLFQVENAHDAFFDVQIIVGERLFYCHKLVLQLNSQYFEKQSLQSGTVTLQGINPEQFYEVLRYMYTKEIAVNINNIESLLSIGYMLGMDNLLQICIEFVDGKINDPRINNSRMRLKLELVYRKQAAYHFNRMISSSSLVLKTPETFLKAVLSDDNLEVKSEVEVCRVLLGWLKVQTEAGHEVYPDQLLPLIRWSGISIDDARLLLFRSDAVMTDPASIEFLSKVITYLLSGVEFEGLQTFRRPSTGYENCLITVGLWDRFTSSREVCRINLQHPGKLTELNELCTTVNNTSAACAYDTGVYIVGTGGPPYKEVWKWDAETGWKRCADMLTGRGYHCVTVVDLCLHALGGKTAHGVTASVESYNANTNKWSPGGELVHAVQNAASVAYNKSIYVFGGKTREKIVGYVQVYNTANRDCMLLKRPMPRAHYAMRAMLWETSVILIDNSNCYIYNFETQTWQERKQFQTEGDYFAAVLNNGTVYAAGGSCNRRDKQNKLLQTCTEEIKSVSVMDIINDKPAAWRPHAELPKPAMITAFAFISLPIVK